jgi:peptidoglycan/LPS O-acetylase OafA/YrhL
MSEHSHPHAEPPDTLGQILSAVCAVHCVSLPLFMTVAPAAASVLGGAHPVLLVLVIGVAVWSFVPGYRCHRSKLVAGLAVTGISLLAIAAFLLHGSLVLETAVSLVGASVMMTAHWQNRKLLREAHSHAHAH